jgi:hypothetical protein
MLAWAAAAARGPAEAEGRAWLALCDEIAELRLHGWHLYDGLPVEARAAYHSSREARARLRDAVGAARWERAQEAEAADKAALLAWVAGFQAAREHAAMVEASDCGGRGPGREMGG